MRGPHLVQQGLGCLPAAIKQRAAHLLGRSRGLLHVLLGGVIGAAVAADGPTPHGLHCCTAQAGVGAVQQQSAGAKHGLGGGGQHRVLQHVQVLALSGGGRRGRLQPRQRHLPREWAPCGRRQKAVAHASKSVGLAGPQLHQELGDRCAPLG